MQKKQISQFVKVNKEIIDSLGNGDRLFYFPHGTADADHSDAYTLYTIIDHDKLSFTFLNVFDQKEHKLTLAHQKILESGKWFYQQ